MVTQAFCDERFQRVSEKIESGFKTLSDKIDELKEAKKEESHFWRNVLGTILSGAAVALITAALLLFH
jgi:hypothetical protein